ncbi:ski2-like helicase [Pelagimonas phthalicica]|uniref:Ski2-like helicase n=1 Tax=Pelagimonas phthalicica TaxID=1037362 RepID=A0A238JGV2_9RHOB|nr:DEAD/DEAH box helicase [Pelagimonas phthalicica]TDS92122.1 RAD3-like DEAD/DEAH box helicase [Pelagimonas phthalicica]SMX29172.1 ski2-like helicase [Pelagimonas phthalicica]
MKIAIFSTLWGSSTGGIDVCSKELVHSLAQSGDHEVCAFYKVRTQQLVSDGEKYGFTVITPDDRVVDDVDASQLGHWTRIEARAAIPQLLSKRFKPDLVIVNDIFGRELIPVLREYFSEAKIATLFHSAYGRSEARKGVLDTDIERKENYQRELIEQSDLIFSVGSFSVEYLKYLSPKSAEKINFLYPGLPNIKSRATKSTRFSAASFGRLDRKSDTIKQISISAEAWASARSSGHISELATDDVTFTAIGSRGAEPVLDDVKSKLEGTWKANLRELPFEEISDFDQSRLKDTLDRCAFVLLNSWYENFGLTFLETCTFGVPTVVSRSSGFFVDAIELLGEEAKDYILSVDTDGASRSELIAELEKTLIAASANYERTFANAQRLSDLLREKWPNWSDAVKSIVDAVESSPTVSSSGSVSHEENDTIEIAHSYPWRETLEDLMDWTWSKNVLHYSNLKGLPQFRQNSGFFLTPLQKKFWDERQSLLQSGFKDVVLSGGTSSGKTTLAETLFGLARPNEFARTRVLYVAPTKALAQEKARSWRKKYPSASLGRDSFDPVIVSTGDDNASDGALIRGEFNIACTVYEKANVILSASQELFEKINLVIIDEFHMIEDLHRGSILEALLAKIKREKERRLESVDEGNHLRLVVITTEGASSKLRDYLSYTDYETLDTVYPLVISDTSRAMRVEHSAFFPGRTDAQSLPLFAVKSFETDEQLSLTQEAADDLSGQHAIFQKGVVRIGEAAKIDRRQQRWDQYHDFIDHWYAQNPTGRRLLIFMNSKYEVVEVAKFLKNKISKKTFQTLDSGVLALSPNEDGLAEVALSLDEVEETEFVKDLRRCLIEGVFIHDADVPQSVRESFETYLGKALDETSRSEIIVATETLSYGVNLRVSDVALFNVLFPEGERIQTRRPKPILLSRCDFVNMSGRAGRLGQATRDGSARVYWYLDPEDEKSFEAVLEQFYVRQPSISSQLFHRADTRIALDYQKMAKSLVPTASSTQSETGAESSSNAVERFSYPFVRTVLDGLRFLGGSESETGFLEKVGCTDDELNQEFLSKTFYYREKCEPHEGESSDSSQQVLIQRATHLATSARQILQSAKSDRYGLVREPRTGGYQITALGSSTIDTGTEIATVSQLRRAVIELRDFWAGRFERSLPFELAVFPVFFQPEVHRQYLLRLPEFSHAMDWNPVENRNDLLIRTSEALSAMGAISEEDANRLVHVSNAFLEWTVANQPIVSEQGRYEEAAHDACLRLYLAFLHWISGASLGEVIGEVQRLYGTAPTKTESSVFNFEAFADNLTWKILFLISLIRTSGELILPPSSTFDAVRFVHRARFGCSEKAIPLLFKNKRERPPLNRVAAHSLLSGQNTTASIALGSLDESSGLNQKQILATTRQVREFIDESFQEISRQFNYLASGSGLNRINEETAKSYWDYSRAQITALLSTSIAEDSVSLEVFPTKETQETEIPTGSDGEPRVVFRETFSGIGIDVFNQTLDPSNKERVITSRTASVDAHFVFDENASLEAEDPGGAHRLFVDFPWTTGSVGHAAGGCRLSPAAFGIVLSLCARNFVVDVSGYLQAILRTDKKVPIGVRELFGISEPHLRKNTFPEAIFEAWAKYIEVGEF